MKYPLGVLLTDSHISLHNSELNKDLCKQAIEFAREMNVNTIFHAGDIFTARKSQPLSTLKTFEEILIMIKNAGMQLIAIPGNHDKVSYVSEDSYLDPYRHWPGFTLFSDYGVLEYDSTAIHFIPYFEEGKIYNNYLDEAIANSIHFETNILITHIAVNGVRNNDGTEVSEGIGVSRFNAFTSVFVGHYHDKSRLSSNIHYVGSTHQHNFGESCDKGFTLLYSDGSYNQHNAIFPKYIKHYIDVEKGGTEEADDLIQAYSCDIEKHNVRFIFTGPEASVKSIDVNKYKKQGFDVAIESQEYNTRIEQAEADSFKQYTKESIREEFDIFCQVQEIKDADFGKKQYLIPTLNSNT